MSRYRIVCTEQEPRGSPHDVAHIVAVGIGDNSNTWKEKLTLRQVLDNLNAGNSFYTVSPSTSREASVSRYDCRGCGRTTIRSGADSVTDNNLDNLNRCRWT